MNKELNLGEGYSMSFLIPAFFIIGFGFILFAIHFIPAILLILIGATLLLAKTGVAISVDLKTATDYSSVLGYRFGKTFNLSDFNQVKLKHTNDATLMQSRGTSNVVRAKTYDLILSSATIEEALVHEFTDYQLALKAFNALINELNYEGLDEIAEKKLQIAKNRPRGKRR